ncbi:MAG: Alanine racemase [Alphaproteobacteria bacterium]|nr:Alanine racemase [Alphaproteobacteria bacterium]
MTASDPVPINILEVDRSAVAENMRSVRRLVGPDRTIFAVVKADAYGFGAEALAPTLLANGADALGVEDLALGLRLRRRGVQATILVYPCTLPNAAEVMVGASLTPVVDDWGWIDALSVASERVPCELFVQIDVARQGSGVPLDEVISLLKAASAMPRLFVRGLCAHTPSGADPEESKEQLRLFNDIVAGAASAGIDIPTKLLAASPLVMGHPETYLNAVDPGRMLYGIAATGESPVPLRPALKSLKTRLVSVKSVAHPSEGGRSVQRRIGLIPLGAADGLKHLGIEKVLVRGQEVRLAGRPSLEHSRLDLSELPSAAVGDEVALVGAQGAREISTAEICSKCGFEPAEFGTLIGKRVTRIYI